MIRMSMRRPVAVAMGYLAVGLMGFLAWQDIPIELLPDTQLPRLTVNGTWRGASPETIEAFLTSPLEAAIQLVEGVEKVVSTSSEGSARIEVEFARDTDMDFARLDLSERLATLEDTELPPGVDRVMVLPYRPPEFAETQGRGLLAYTFTGARTLESLREHLNDVVVPELSRVEGVALVSAYGGRERLLEVELDRELMAAMGVSVGEIRLKLGDLDLVRKPARYDPATSSGPSRYGTVPGPRRTSATPWSRPMPDGSSASPMWPSCATRTRTSGVTTGSIRARRS